MNSILRIRERVLRLFKSLYSIEKQGEYYDNSKQAIKELQRLPWYQYVIDYREREANNAMNSLVDKNTSPELVRYYQARLDCAISFLDYLNNILTE